MKQSTTSFKSIDSAPVSLSPLEIEIEGCAVRFATPWHLESALAHWTHVPAERIASLLERSLPVLKQETDELEALSHRLTRVLEIVRDDPCFINAFLRATPGKTFSRDHGWRSLMAELRRRPWCFDAYKIVATEGYLAYVNTRRELVQNTCGSVPDIGASRDAHATAGGHVHRAKPAPRFDRWPIRLRTS